MPVIAFTPGLILSADLHQETSTINSQLHEVKNSNLINSSIPYSLSMSHLHPDPSHLASSPNETSLVYQCPLYRSNSYVLKSSSPSHAKKIIIQIPLPTERAQEHWILRGTVLCLDPTFFSS